MVIKSPAKLNLFLKVLGKRSDGYHRIETIFERIDLCDKIVLKKRPSGIKIVSSRKDLPTDETNLAHKAASALLAKTRVSHGVTIEIKKNIPISAGLGGGSSNAASVLLGLNRLYGFGFGLKELLPLARKLGADVAFFTHELSFAKGVSRGDVITPIASGFKLWHIVIMPPFGLSAKEVYECIGLCRESGRNGASAVIKAVKNKNLTGLNGLLYNSLEEAVLARSSEIRRIKEGLAGVTKQKTLVSGSGPAVFGLASSRKEAIDTGKVLREGVLAGKDGWQVYIVRTM